MAEKVLDNEFKFDEIAVEGGLSDFFLPAYLLDYFLASGSLLSKVNWHLKFCNQFGGKILRKK